MNTLQFSLNRNDICEIIIFVNMNNIIKMNMWQIGIGIYL